MGNFNALSVVILATAFVSLIAGISLFWSARKPGSSSSPRTTNRIAWLLIALFPVLILFSFFPSTTFTGTLLGFSATGAAALFIFLWWYGSTKAIQDIQADQESALKQAGLIDQKNHVEQLNNQIRALQNDLEKSQKLAAAEQKPQVLTETKVFRCPLRSAPDKCIGLITGNLQGVHVADIWVNSENNNMLMSRWNEGTISGTIRYLGAKKDDAGELLEDGDVIARELKEKMGKRTSVQPTTVFMTSPGELVRPPYNVKAILHVASVQGTPVKGYSSIENVEDCVTRVLQFTQRDDEILQNCKSVVFPLLGAGVGKANPAVVAEKLLTRAINYLESNPQGRIDCVYFLAWTNLALEICKDVLRRSDKVETREIDV